MPYEGLDDRMDRLETVLMDFIRHSDEALARFRTEISIFRTEVAAISR